MNIHPLGDVHDELDVGVIVVVGTSRHLFARRAISRVLSTGTSPAPLRGKPEMLSSALCTHLNILISHSNVIRICSEVFWRSHHSKLDGPLVAEGFVGPFSDRSYLFHSCDTVVGYEDLDESDVRAKCTAKQADGLEWYRCDNSVSIAVGNKVLDPSCWGRS